jgi:hypothetical protein
LFNRQKTHVVLDTRRGGQHRTGVYIGEVIKHFEDSERDIWKIFLPSNSLLLSVHFARLTAYCSLKEEELRFPFPVKFIG